MPNATKVNANKVKTGLEVINVIQELKMTLEYRLNSKHFGKMESKFRVEDERKRDEFLAKEKTKLIQLVKDKRRDAKVFKTVDKEIKGIIFKKFPAKIDEYNRAFAGVYTEPGSFLIAFNHKRIQEIYNNKMPKSIAEHYGIEIEFMSKKNRETIANELFKEGLVDNCCLKTDGSLRPDAGYIAHELAILCKKSELESVMKRVCAALDRTGSKINKSCGLHVHLDMRSRDHKKSFNNLVKAQDVLRGMQPASRRDEKWCKANKSGDFDAEVSSGNERYKVINPQSFGKFKTLEVRVHSGTTDYKKITNWCKILTKINEYPSSIRNYLKDVNDFCSKFEIEGELKDYINERVSTFKDVSVGSDD